MNRTKVSRTQLKKCLETVCDSEKLRNNIMSRIDDRLDSKYQCTVVDVEQVFLKCTENKSMLGSLHQEIQNIGKSDPKPKSKTSKTKTK